MTTPTRRGTQAQAQQRRVAQEDYKQEQQKARLATLAKTARLKALRLAKEAAEKAASDTAPKPAPRKKPAAKSPAAARVIRVSKQR